MTNFYIYITVKSVFREDLHWNCKVTLIEEKAEKKITHVQQKKTEINRKEDIIKQSEEKRTKISNNCNEWVLLRKYTSNFHVFKLSTHLYLNCLFRRKRLPNQFQFWSGIWTIKRCNFVCVDGCVISCICGMCTNTISYRYNFVQCIFLNVFFR